MNLKLSLALSLLAITNILKADDLMKNIEPDANGNIGRQEIQAAIKKTLGTAKDIGGYSQAQIANIIARTIFKEASGETSEGRKAIASVIYNRAKPGITNGKDVRSFVNVCWKPLQFSCWNQANPLSNPSKYSGKKYQIVLPSGAEQPTAKEVWEECKELASQLVLGEFNSTIGNLNTYYNPDKASPSWGSSLQDVKTIGNHKFGYLPENDGNRKIKVQGKNEKFHIVKKGDSISKIIKKYKLSIDDFKKMNPSIKDLNKINIGQKLRIRK